MGNLMHPTHFSNGLTNCRAGESTSEDEHGEPSPIRYVRYFSDFTGMGPEADIMTGTPIVHTVTTVGSGTITLAPPAAGTLGGWLDIANSAANNDAITIQTKDIPFIVSNALEDFLVVTSFNVDNATNAALQIGLCNITTTPLSATSGVWFTKAAASTTLSAQVCKASTKTTIGTTTVANATSLKVAIRYVARAARLDFLVNDVVTASTTTTTNIPIVGLTPTIYLKNGTAAARTMYVDYFGAFVQRY